MMSVLTYLFHPNPGHVMYTSPAVIVVVILCAVLIVLSFAIQYWRGRLQNAVTKKLSRSWSSLCFWFGVVGLVLTVSRVETIQFIAMRFLWVLWAAFLLLAIVFQWRLYRMRHYAVLPRAERTDPRDQYLPGKKR